MINCKRCGHETQAEITQLCNNCWEVESRLERYLKSPKAKEFVTDKLNTVVASNIKQGECFRRPSGNKVYLRISDNAARYYQLPLGYIYGVTKDGNMTNVHHDQLVIKVPMDSFIKIV